MKKIRSQKGQALILIALAVVGLVGFTALTIDGGRVLSDRRHAQNTADTSALAAALAKIKGEDYVLAAKARATNNGYTTGVDNAVVEVILCNAAPTDDKCQGINAASSSEYIRVRIHSFVPTTFARVLGRTVVENTVEAITRVQGSTSSGTFFGGAGMASVRDDNVDDCVHFNGSSDVYLHNTGLFVNCSGIQAVRVDGNADIGSDAGAQIAGCHDTHGSAVITGPDWDDGCYSSQQTVSASTFAHVPTTLPYPTCPAAGMPSRTPDTVNKKLEPGNYANQITINDTYTISAGTYCFMNGFNANGNGNSLQQSDTGTIRIYSGADFGVGSGSTNTFKDLELYFVNNDLKVNSYFKADRFRFFATGTGNLIVNANGSLYSDDAYIYSYRGELRTNSGVTVDITAPKSPDLFAGLLIYLPWDDNDIAGGSAGEPWDMNGGVNSSLTGTILMPTKKVQPNGGADTVIHGQIIAYTFLVNGNHSLDIWYDPAENYGSPSSPTIEITR